MSLLKDVGAGLDLVHLLVEEERVLHEELHEAVGLAGTGRIRTVRVSTALSGGVETVDHSPWP